MSESATKSVLKALANYLKANMPTLAEAITDFPSPSEKLNYPSLSVFARVPEFRQIAPYPVSIKQHGPVDDPLPAATILSVFGIWDFSIQIDMWSSYKPQRHTLVEELTKAFAVDLEKPGINVQMADYFDQWATYALGGPVEFVDDEQGSQRNEWRARVVVNANCRAVREHSGSVIQTIENNVETSESSIGLPEEPDDSVIF